MFAGIMMFDASAQPSQEVRRALGRAVSRASGASPIECHSGALFVVRIATGSLFEYDGVLRGRQGDLCVVGGEPLATGGTPEADQRLIHEALAENNTAPLAACRGVFCGISYHPQQQPSCLHLFGDRLGVRPLYYWVGANEVVFASALRILENLPFVPKRRDDRGVAEAIAFGYPLADRTQYAGIRVIREAEHIEVSAGSVKREHYFRWSRRPSYRCHNSQAVVAAHELFQDALRVRRKGDRAVTAFLSGGMDSRAIVAALHGAGARVQALNFSPSDSQDLALAQGYADAIGIPLLAAPRRRDPEGGFRLALTRHVMQLVANGQVTADRPRALWSGDGGSVGLGNVHLDDKLVHLMRLGRRDQAIQDFFRFNQIGFPYRLMRPAERAGIRDLLSLGVAEELDRLECEDPGQSLFLFLMVNDQRRHLYDVYEDLDHHRLEYQLPFFDGPFLEFICGLPIEYRNNHRFYTDWFNAFPAPTRSVPWQTYPDHVPCPLPIPPELAYQWRPPTPSLGIRVRKRLLSGYRALTLATRSHDLGPVSRSRLLGLAGVQLAGLRDYAYAVRAADWYGNLSGGLTR